MSNSFILRRFIFYFIIHCTWRSCTLGDVCPDAHMCTHTHKPACIIWLHTFRGSFRKTAAAQGVLSACVIFNLRNIRKRTAASQKWSGAGFGQDFCSCQGDLKDRFPPSFPGILAQLMQVGSLPGLPRKVCNSFAKVMSAKSSFWKTSAEFRIF